jgi:hypothetical protein
LDFFSTTEGRTWLDKFEDLANSSHYNWTDLTEDLLVWNQVEEPVEVQPGKTLEIYQVVGTCGHATIRTEHFETTILNSVDKRRAQLYYQNDLAVS